MLSLVGTIIPAPKTTSNITFRIKIDMSTIRFCGKYTQMNQYEEK
jgi:hypothetical protein